jgi:hypothetical protein
MPDAIIPHLMKTFRQGMLEISTNKLDPFYSAGFPFTRSAVLIPGDLHSKGGRIWGKIALKRGPL